MPHALMYNTKPLQAPLKFSPLPELPENDTIYSYKEFENTRLSSPFPDRCLLEALKECESNPEALRFSVATPTRLTLKTSKPSFSFEELPGDGASGGYEETVDELDDLVDSLRKESVGNGPSRSVCLRRPEWGYKILVQVQTNEKVKFSFTKNVLVTCVTISPIQDQNEKREFEQAVFCCGKSTSVRLGCFGVRWAVDLRPDGKAERRGLVKKMIALKRCLRKKHVAFDDEKEHLLLG